jgi:hypothetical protein
MKNLLTRISRRERLYLMIGGLVLFLGLVVYPAGKKAAAFRAEQFELLGDDLLLLEELYALEFDAYAIEEENETLLAGLKKADDLLFPPIENRILTQTAMTKLFNELGPDLELETTAGRSSVGDASNQMNLELKGEGRYPELLKFLHRVETYRPLILIQDFSLAERQTRRRFGGRGGSRQQTSEPRLTLRLSVQIICQDGGQQ